MDVPAFCGSCGAVFPSGIVVEKSANAAFAGDPSNLCSVCGSTGHIPDGLLGFVENSIEVLAAPERTNAELSRLAEILYTEKAEKQSRIHLADTIRTELPTISALADVLVATQSQLDGFIALIAAVIDLRLKEDSSDTTVVSVNDVVNRVFSETDRSAQFQQHLRGGPNRVPRNDPCTCGSGKKYKQCCGKLQ